MANYDEAILQHFADSLYRKANQLVWATALGWGLIAFLVALFMGAIVAGSPVLSRELNGFDGSTAFGTAVVFAVVIGTFGAFRGAAKGDLLKLEAQRTLCQMQIERNTRVSKEASVELVRAANS